MIKNLCLLLIFILVLSCKTDDKKAREVTAYDIGQFLNNENVFGSSFNQDESKLLIGSNKSGIYNAYTVDLISGEIKALSQSTDQSIWPISYFPEDDRFLYSSDNDGDEINHIFVMNEDGTSTDLTPDTGAKANFQGWAKDKKSFFYGSNKRNPQFFDFYEYQLANATSTLIYQNDEGYDVAGISNDKRYLSLLKTITTNDSDLFLYDSQTKESKKVNQTQAAHSFADFSIDNTSLYYLTDLDAEFQYLVKYDIADGSSTMARKDDWDIWYAYFSETGKYQVIGVNKDAKTEITILNTSDGSEVKAPQIEKGEISSVSISDSEKWMAYYGGSSNNPSNLYMYNLESGESKQLTNTLNPEINQEDLVEGEVLRFKSFDGLEIPAILFRPHQADKNNKVPALIQVHGGPGGQTRMNYSSLYQYLVNHGYAVLCVNNRGSSGYGKTFYRMDDQKHGDVDLKDCIEGKNYLADLDWIDEDKIGILGGSYGGYMVMQAMSHAPDEFKVGVNLFGVTNWLRTLKSIPPWWASFKDALYQEMGDPNTADSTRLYEISPLFHANKIKNPVIVLQGSKDPRVLQVESDEMVAGMKANNVPVEYVLFEDEGHGFVKKENQIEGWSRILAFLDQHLKQEVKD